MSDESPPPRTEEIVPLPPLPRPPSSPFALISTPPGMLPLKPCGVNDSTRVHPRDIVRRAQRESLVLVIVHASLLVRLHTTRLDGR